MNSCWDNGTCSSYLNEKQKHVRCTRNIVEDGFCRYHKKSKNYFPQLLSEIKSKDIKKYKINGKINGKLFWYIETKKINDKINAFYNMLDFSMSHFLMGMYDSWREIPFKYIINVDEEWWDIRLLLNNITEKINQSNMENPYPIYPSSPFNRKPYSLQALDKINDRISKLNLQINIALKKLMSSSNAILNKCYTEAKGSNDTYSSTLLKTLTSTLRYKLINNLNSQHNYLGHWVSKKERRSDFELVYFDLLNTPPQCICPYYGTVIDNPERMIIYDLLVALPSESWDTVNDYTKN